MKSKRHAKILEIISTNIINTQEELLKKLNELGFNATQATISRDIKELRLIKTQGENGQYRYTAAVQTEFSNNTTKFITIFSESVVNVDYSGHMVAIKCFPGMANAVAILLDSIHWDGLVGTVAGDDTIFILMRNENFAREMAAKFTKMVINK